VLCNNRVTFNDPRLFSYFISYLRGVSLYDNFVLEEDKDSKSLVMDTDKTAWKYALTKFIIETGTSCDNFDYFDFYKNHKEWIKCRCDKILNVSTPTHIIDLLNSYRTQPQLHVNTLGLCEAALDTQGYGHNTPSLTAMMLKMLTTPHDTQRDIHSGVLEMNLLSKLQEYQHHLKKHKNEIFYSEKLRNQKSEIIGDAMRTLKNEGVNATVEFLENSSIMHHSFWGKLAQSQGAKMLKAFKVANQLC
jgi:hypothetical protein